MKHNPQATANAAAVTVAAWYVICAGAFAIAPDFAMSVAQSWFHGIALSQIGTPVVTSSSFILGIITATGLAWVTGYFFAMCYNKFMK